MNIRQFNSGGITNMKTVCWLIIFFVTIFFQMISVLPCAFATASSPYPSSSIIKIIEFDVTSHIRKAPGSDNWPVTWGDDGHIYTSWGDGGGFGGTNSDGRVSLGVARVEGGKVNYSGYNVWGGKNTDNPAQFGGKSYGIISVDGILYMWWGPGSNTYVYNQTRLLKSIDHGATWTKSNWDFTDIDSSLIMPTICNFGRDYSGARDNYVYHYFIRKQGNPSSLGVHKPGKIDLARVHKDSMMDQSTYEFFAGLDNTGNPIWTSQAINRVSVFEDSEGVGWNLSVSYNPGIDRYLLMTEHTNSFQGNLGIFDAPEPWGPWTTIGYYNNWEDFGSNFFWNFSNKWLSDNGTSFVLVFTGIGENDSWNTIEGNLTLSSQSAQDEENLLPPKDVRVLEE
ncbi:MAG: DUF4185 domain-containing protein [Candidatus Marinimicrobia bacterium]|nr:DUF4185 domain-containing protein [Candidatus Neomarinimicrobiota bacterium]